MHLFLSDSYVVVGLGERDMEEGSAGRHSRWLGRWKNRSREPIQAQVSCTSAGHRFDRGERCSAGQLAARVVGVRAAGRRQIWADAAGP